MQLVLLTLPAEMRLALESHESNWALLACLFLILLESFAGESVSSVVSLFRFRFLRLDERLLVSVGSELLLYCAATVRRDSAHAIFSSEFVVILGGDVLT